MSRPSKGFLPVPATAVAYPDAAGPGWVGIRRRTNSGLVSADSVPWSEGEPPASYGSSRLIIGGSGGMDYMGITHHGVKGNGFIR